MSSSSSSQDNNKFQRQVVHSLDSLASSLRSLQDAINNNELDTQKNLISQSTKLLTTVRQDIRRLEQSIDTIDDVVAKNTVRLSCRNYQTKLADSETRFKALKDQSERSLLFDGNARKKIGTESGTQSDYTSLHAQTEASIGRSNQHLVGAIQTLDETHTIGINVLSEVGQQNETLRRTHNTAYTTNQTTSEARSTLQHMSRRAMYNKAILWTIIVILVCIDLYAVFRKLKK